MHDGALALPIVELRGDPRQLGEAHGRRLASQIRTLVGSLDRYIIDARPRPQALAFRSLARLTARWLDRRTAPRHRHELRAIARAARIDLGAILLVNYFDDVLNILRPLGGRQALACSVGIVDAPAGPVHLRGLDYYFPAGFTPFAAEAAATMRSMQTLFVVHGTGVQPFVSLGWPGYAGVVTGWNEAGISLGSLTSYVPAGLPDGVASGMLYRQCLEVAHGVGDVVTLVDRLGCPIGNNLSLVDGATGDAAVVELAPGKPAVRRPPPFDRCATNHFVSSPLASAQAGEVPEHSYLRERRLQELLTGPVSHADILLDRHQLGGGPHGAIDNPGTVQSVIFDHGSGTMAIRLWGRDGADLGFERIDVTRLLAGTAEPSRAG